MPEPRDKHLYDIIKRQVYADIPKHSAYRSGILVQRYKKAYFTKYNSNNPYIGKKTPDRGLTRWFDEKWTNQRGEIGYKRKSDVYRPNVRVTPDTPTTFGELTSKQISRARAEKYRKGRVRKFV